MGLKKIWLKLFNRREYLSYKSAKIEERKKKIYETRIRKVLNRYDEILNKKNEITFLHSGHLGDVINALPLIKEVSKSKKCNYLIESKKLIPNHAIDEKHPFGNFFLDEKARDMLLPLLGEQKYLNKVDKYNNDEIDIDLNFFRELPINFNLDSVRWYFHLTGVHANLNEPYLEVEDHKLIKNKVIIIRNTRRKNFLINYKFLDQYDDLIFLGLENEFNDLKKDIKKLEFYNCKDFLEMAQIIKNCKVFIGNLSFGYTIAEALKVPRLLESNPDFPLIYPNGGRGFDFYFQNHFEKMFKQFYKN